MCYQDICGIFSFFLLLYEALKMNEKKNEKRIFSLKVWKIDRFLMRLTKDDSEVNLASGEAEPEFSEWKWSNPEEVIEQVCCKNFNHEYS